MSAILDRIKETAGDVASSPFVTDAKEKLGDIFSADNVDTFKGKAGDTLSAALPYLLSGGAGALAGGLMTRRQNEEDGETRGQYLSRVLRNALLTGGLAGGGHYLVNQGLNSIVGNAGDRQSGVVTGDTETDGPLSSSVKNIAFSPMTALGAGATGLALTKNKSLIGVPDTATDLKLLADDLGGVDPERLKRMSPTEIDELMEASKGKATNKMRRAAGLPSAATKGSTWDFLDRVPGVDKGKLSNFGRRHAGQLFGQTPERWAGRGAIGLAAAGIPALLGAALTDPS